MALVHDLMHESQIQDSLQHLDSIQRSANLASDATLANQRVDAKESRRRNRLRDDMFRESQKNIDLKRENDALKAQLEQQKRITEQEKKKNAAIREVAASLILTRDSFSKTLKFFNKKWVPREEQEGNQKEMFEKVEEIKEDNRNNPDIVKKAYNIVDETSSNLIAKKNEQVKAKNKIK